MSCPRCKSSDIWDDNLWWGCNACGYAASPDGPSFIFAKDAAGLARSVDEMKNRGQIPRNHSGGFIEVVPLQPGDDDE